MSDAKQFLSIPETAEHLGVSERLVAERIAVGDLPSVKIGGRRLVPVAQLAAWVQSKVEQGRARKP